MRTFTVLSLLASFSCNSYGFTGNEMLKDCEGYQDYCLGYVTGIVEATDTYVEWKKMESGFCIPAGVSRGQLESVAVKYLKDNPSKLHLNAASLVANALSHSFPC